MARTLGMRLRNGNGDVDEDDDGRLMTTKAQRSTQQVQLAPEKEILMEMGRENGVGDGDEVLDENEPWPQLHTKPVATATN